VASAGATATCHRRDAVWGHNVRRAGPSSSARPPTPPAPNPLRRAPRTPGNTNPYIWAAWGYLEYRTGNVSRARKLFDAAIVVDETHAAAWHKWGMLEMRQGNFLRARCAGICEGRLGLARHVARGPAQKPRLACSICASLPAAHPSRRPLSMVGAPQGPVDARHPEVPPRAAEEQHLPLLLPRGHGGGAGQAGRGALLVRGGHAHKPGQGELRAVARVGSRGGADR
jgi:hypothetical protein